MQLKYGILFSLYLAPLFLYSRSSHSQNKEEARRHFKQAVVLYKEGNYTAALVEFKASYKANPNWKIRYHIAVTLQALHDFVGAEKELRAYLDEGGNEVSEEKKKEVKDLLDQLAGVIGSLIVEANEVDASIYVNGDLVGKTPLSQSVRLSVGKYRVEVKKKGYKDYAESVEIPGGGIITMKVVLEKEPEQQRGEEAGKKGEDLTKERATVEPGEAVQGVPVEVVKKQKEAEVAKARKRHPLRVAGWTAVGLGGVLLAAGAATGGTALSLGKEIEEKCSSEGCEPEYHDENNRMNSLAMSTDLLVGAGAAVAAAGAILLIIDWKREAKPGKKLSAGPILPAGLSLKWRYR